MDKFKVKASFRAQARSARREFSARAAPDAPEKAAEHFCEHIDVESAEVVSGYWPIREEINPIPLLTRLRRTDRACALPVVQGRDRPLVFREWTPDDALVPGVFGTSEPPPSARELAPHILIVPLLAFDGRGYRLGYGGGYYDRTLHLLRQASKHCVAVGYAYSGQEVEALPVTDADERLDWVVTEAWARAFS